MLERNEVTRFASANENLQTTITATAAPANQQASLLTSMLFLKCQRLGKGQVIVTSPYICRMQWGDRFLHTVPPSQKLTSLILGKHACQPCWAGWWFCAATGWQHLNNLFSYYKPHPSPRHPCNVSSSGAAPHIWLLKRLMLWGRRGKDSTLWCHKTIPTLKPCQRQGPNSDSPNCWCWL